MTKAPPVHCCVSARLFAWEVLFTSGPRRYTRENWREKEGNEECDSRGHACDAGLRTNSNTGR